MGAWQRTPPQTDARAHPQGLLPLALREVRILLQIATTVMHGAQALATAWLDFVESFQCTAGACLVPESRVFDLLSTLGQLRQAVALARQMLAAFCATLAAPLDAAMYPLLDLNFATGLHHLWNTALQVTLVVPHATCVRCGLARDDTFRTLLCTPDLEPAFGYLVAGIGELGLAVDNWANVVFAIVQSALLGNAPTCESQAGAMTPSAWLDAPTFGSNFTAVVGLTQWMYAVTDGYLAVYLGGENGGGLRTQRWPYAMDPALGVAAVAYGPASDLDASSVTGAPLPFCALSVSRARPLTRRLGPQAPAPRGASRRPR